MKINVEKTEVMVAGKIKHTVNIKLNNKMIKQTDNFKYLGSVINAQGDLSEKINESIQCATRLDHTLNKIFLGKKKLVLRCLILFKLQNKNYQNNFFNRDLMAMKYFNSLTR